MEVLIAALLSHRSHSPASHLKQFKFWNKNDQQWSHGLVVRTLDSESSNPSSNLGGTSSFLFYFFFQLGFNQLQLLAQQLSQYCCIQGQHSTGLSNTKCSSWAHQGSTKFFVFLFSLHIGIS